MIFQSLPIFFGLPSNWRELFLEEAFALQMHLNMSHDQAYKMPVRYRKWYLERLQRHYKDKYSKSVDEAKPINNENKLKEYESKLQKKFKNN